MPKYVLTYQGEMSMEDMPTDPEAIQAMMAKWGAWYESMGSGLVDGGAPFSVSSAIDASGATDAPAKITGYTIIEAADMAAATAIAKGSPVIENGHTVQISEAIDMGM
jgi:hypothetical protein